MHRATAQGAPTSCGRHHARKCNAAPRSEARAGAV